MIVVDASVWVDRLTGTLDDRWRTMLTSADPIGPPHVDFEVGSALLRMERHQQLDSGVAHTLIKAFAARPFERLRHAEDPVAAYRFLNNAHFADAIYLAMATRLECPVITSDKGMIKAARINRVDVVDARHGRESE